MAEDSSSIVEKLPGRPLTVPEGQQLDDQETDRSWIRPESIMMRNGNQVVVALMAVNRVSDHCWLLGYSPECGAWLVVDEWDYEELEHDRFYELLEQWEAETFDGCSEYLVG